MVIKRSLVKRNLTAEVPPSEELAQIRGALRERIELTGLRSTARELQMSPTGLRGFVEGAAPYVKTMRRARAWMAERAREAGQPDAADDAAIAVLLSPLPSDRREAGRARLQALVAELRWG